MNPPNNVLFAVVTKLGIVGKYSINIAIGNYNPNIIHVKLDEVLTFRVIDNSSYKDGAKGCFVGYWPGLIRPKLEWATKFDDYV